MHVNVTFRKIALIILRVDFIRVVVKMLRFIRPYNKVSKLKRNALITHGYCLRRQLNMIKECSVFMYLNVCIAYEIIKLRSNGAILDRYVKKEDD